MAYLEFGCRPTIIGSMPHTDAGPASRLIAHYLKDMPAWPQLPRRSPLENMYTQFSEGFPGAVIRDGKLSVARSQELDRQLERLYSAYLANNIDEFPISSEYAAGLHAFLGMGLSPLAVKGQVIGPVSFGLTVTDESGRSLIYDDILADAAARLLKLKAAWQEKQLGRLSKKTVIFLDEPYMTSFGSSFVPVSREKVISLLNEVFSGIQGVKGVHCCGNTDWSVLASTRADILSFDAYNYAQSLALYPDEVGKLLERGGGVAWGIVPNERNALAEESSASLKDRLEEAIAPFTRRGIPFRTLIKQGLLTPCCGLASLSVAEAESALELLATLSTRIRERYL